MSGRIVMRHGGRVYRDWTRAEIKRDLGEISGSFTFEYNDQARAASGLPPMPGRQLLFVALAPGSTQVDIEVDGELVLRGYIDDVDLQLDGEQIRATITGRDRTGDLVDSTANPDGPAEYRDLTLTEIARRLVQRFGISVTADVDVGAKFPRFSLDTSETVLSALEKAARQRSVLTLSDGIGGLLLTRAGRRRGPAPLVMPGNVLSLATRLSWQNRFSDYIVKGQTENPAKKKVALDGTARPLDPDGPVDPKKAEARKKSTRSTIVMTGRAKDPEVTRYRPRVWTVRTQSGGASVAEQAAWRMRTARGASEGVTYAVKGWRDGTEQRLWRPNEIVLVDDGYSLFGSDMLIAGVTYQDGEEGARTQLRVVGPETYDRIDEGDSRARRETRRLERERKLKKQLDGTARPLGER
ncbi:MAG: hypothetical protein E7K72_02230 [Roseomonas mucosa]|nr:hypothetical protein [Roseomonas mucosa]